jgi:type IX secretion system PorP/SprF family membrane protein
MKIFYSILAGCLAASAVYAQEDYHLSQMEAAPLYLNPATTGMLCGEKGDYRINSDYRSQWTSLAIKPYSTAYVSYDMPVRKINHMQRANNKWGVGGYLIDNKAGAGEFNSLNIMASGAYNITNRSHKHFLCVGLQVGLLYKSFNPAVYTYDIQYSSATGSFDTNIDNEENFKNTTLIRFDSNLGLFYKYGSKRTKTRPYGGFSVYHLSKPVDAFTDSRTRLPMRFVLHTGADIIINEKVSLRPHFIYMNQAKAYDVNLGSLVFCKINNSTLEALAGIDYRWKDAIVFHVGFRQDQHYFRFSYDVNTSSLINYTRGRGAWEFSLIIVGLRNRAVFKPMF